MFLSPSLSKLLFFKIVIKHFFHALFFFIFLNYLCPTVFRSHLISLVTMQLSWCFKTAFIFLYWWVLFQKLLFFSWMSIVLQLITSENIFLAWMFFFNLFSTFLLTPNISFFCDFSMSTVILNFSYKLSSAKAKRKLWRLSCNPLYLF